MLSVTFGSVGRDTPLPGCQLVASRSVRFLLCVAFSLHLSAPFASPGGEGREMKGKSRPLAKQSFLLLQGKKDTAIAELFFLKRGAFKNLLKKQPTREDAIARSRRLPLTNCRNIVTSS